ncbi:MAG: hypothetical protein CFE23_16415 [Flavobacterium sp. BFFFF1]|uniref:hypothetical protein n=1 Tax=Flavobacterium sp. BFFFF1 TaxID=2015557 RepID=UPI000BD9CF7B|nr:hypothetical protein [Flavobacterium sp. BFFFF1]OYU78925.1 MAG: hypothetical protein CFE23_16415 [Flavobacterium sp. BFFFF1]
MKDIQNESITNLILYAILFLVLGLATIVWQLHDKKKSQEKGEYRNLLDVFRLWIAAIVFISVFLAYVIELFKRL